MDIFEITFHVLRSSHPEVFCKRGALNNFTKFLGKHVSESFINKAAGPGPVTLLKETLTQVFSSEFCESFLRVSFFIKHLLWLFLHFGA